MIKHLVFWKQKGTQQEKETVDTTFRQMICDLIKVLPQMVQAEVGVNVNTGNFDVCIDSVFRNREEFDYYMFYPDHVKIKEYMTAASCDKMVFDYECEV